MIGSRSRPAVLFAAWWMLMFAETANAQEVGYRDLSFSNTTGQGTPALDARVFYPATATGFATPIATPPPGGHPVVVFLHGFSVIGNQYPLLGVHFATEGFVTVMSNTAQFSGSTQTADGLALFHALVTANSQVGGVLEGALDMTKAAVCGHSMGGSSTMRILAQNPGYAAGLVWGSGFAGATILSQVTVPFGVVHGQGDALDWTTTALANFNGATNFVGHKFAYVFDPSGGHNNIVGGLSVPEDVEVWERSARVATGFFARYLQDDVAGLEEVFGPTARGEPRLAELRVAVQAPDLWSVGSGSLNQPFRWTMSAEPGVAAILVAATTGSIPTPFGVFGLDPATTLVAAQGVVDTRRYLPLSFTIPNDPTFVGVQIPYQGFGPRVDGAYRLTGTGTLSIVP